MLDRLFIEKHFSAGVIVQDDLDPVEEMTLALMHLTTFEERGTVRSWKGYDWNVMNRLCEKELISNPATKAKSVTLSDEARKRSRELFERHFGSPARKRPSEGRVSSADSAATASGRCECPCGEPVEGSVFLPGHDQRLRVALEAKVGGLLALRTLVGAVVSYAHGESALEDMGKSVRRAFWENRGAVQQTAGLPQP